MASIDVASLLEPVSPEEPCGENLEYDPQFGEMERASQGKAEQQIGDSIVAAEDPDWGEVQNLAVELLGRTKDMRIGIFLTLALTRNEGLAGFRDGLAVMRGLVEHFWDGVHPQLDPDDDNDPTMRINAIATLCDREMTLNPLREAPLVSSAVLGRFSLNDIQRATSDLPSEEEGEPGPDKATIDAAFMDCDLDEMKALAEVTRDAKEHADSLENLVTDQVGAANAQSLEKLVGILSSIEKTLNEQLRRRGVFDEPEVDEPEEVGAEPVATSSAGGDGSPLTGDIASRDDVIRAIDKICEYYDRFEPSSPVPLLLKRAKRLASKSFLEILQDLTPDGLSQAEAIGGMSVAAGDGGSDDEDELEGIDSE